MVLPTETPIKQEKDDFEPSSNEEIFPDEYPASDCDFKVKVDVENTLLGVENEWCKTELPSEEYSSFDDYNEFSYEALIDYCKQKCPICNEQFWESYSLLRHNLKHLKLELKPINPFENQCTTCSQYFVDEYALSEHINWAHGEVKFQATKMLHQCKICGRILNYKTWHSHMKEVHGNKEYVCSVCKSTFKCRRYLRVHMTNVHLKKKVGPSAKDELIKCTKCPTVLNSKNALTTHLRTCHSEKRYQCQICHSTLKCRTYLHAHMRRVHYDDGKKHKCDCGKSFKSPRYLKVHIKNAHSNR